MTALPDNIRIQVAAALEEDIGSGDHTAQLIPPNVMAHAKIISREAAVLCGTAWVEEAFKQLDANTVIHWLIKEGDMVEANQTLCEIDGLARAMLTAERTALNFLQTLSGVATATKVYVDAIHGLSSKVMDTRKTIPGLRLAEKYAVKIGGGHNQRIALYDGILIKENHIAACGGIVPALQAARQQNHQVPIQIEVESLEQLQTALNAGATLILLDNFNTSQMRTAVALNAGRAELEASGNITLENIRAVAETGVHRISIGSLTKHIRAIDLSMRFSSPPLEFHS